MSVRVFAPAKINISLRVGIARADGYHPLESLVVFADVGDWVEVGPAAALTLDIEGPFAAELAADADNLVLRAARLLAQEAGVEAKARLRLEKHLPVASGIGGGSSDAAATLKALNALWRLDFAEARLMQIGARLGADVPVCVAARTAWMSGVGEIIAPWRTPPLPAVLVNPLKPMPTGPVFRAFDVAGRASMLAGVRPPMCEHVEEAIALAHSLGNDLSAPARSLMADIAQIEAALRRSARVRHVGLSGSGATVFALFAATEHAHAAASEIAEAHPEWWTQAAMLAAS